MVARADIDIVHVEQQQAVGAFRHFGQKIPFAAVGGAKADIARRIFDQNALPQIILHTADIVDDALQCRCVIGQRQQVMAVMRVDPGPAQMIRNPQRLDPIGERLQRRQIGAVERLVGPDRQRHTVHDHRIIGANPVERRHRASARHHIIFRYDLQPFDRLGPRQEIGIVDGTQAQTEAGRRDRDALVLRHGRARLFPPARCRAPRRREWHQPRSPMTPPPVRHFAAVMALKP